MSWSWLIAPGSALYLLPLVVLAGCVAIARSQLARGPVFVWWGAIAGACVLTAASKISFYGWGTGIRAWNLTCFSGHTVMAFSVWPVIGMLVPRPSRLGWRLTGLVAGLVVAGLIAYSRMSLGAHPPSEVIAGTMLGVPVGAVGAWVLRRVSLPWVFTPTVGLALAAFVAFSPGLGQVLPSEQLFARIGMALSGREEPVNRKKWNSAIIVTNSHDLH